MISAWVPFEATADPHKIMQKSCENMLIEYTWNPQSGEPHSCRQTMLFLIAKAIFLRTAETLQTTKCLLGVSRIVTNNFKGRMS